MDTTSPELVNCPQNIIEATGFENKNKRVTWSEPSAIDLSGNVTLSSQNYLSGSLFSIGTTEIRYVFNDSSGNSVACKFSVTITAPIMGECISVFASHIST